jgi:DNA-binding MarR family transcriptional regulator
MMLSSAAMTNRIDRLEARRLVERKPDPNDRRSVKISLTEEGLELVEAAVKEHVEGQERLLAAMNREDREHLAALLSKPTFSIQSYQQTDTHNSDGTE